MDLLWDFMEVFVFLLILMGFCGAVIVGAAFILTSGQWGWLFLYIPFVAAVLITASDRY